MKILLVTPYDFATPGGVTEHVAQLAVALRQLGHDATVLAPTSRSTLADSGPSFIPAGHVTRVPTNGSVARITLSLGLSGKVRQVLAETSPDVVHVHEPFMPLLPYVTLRYSRACNVATFHAYSGNELGYRHGRIILKRFFARLDGQIAVSESARSFVARYFNADFAIIPNGVCLERFADATPFPELRDGQVNILFVGRLDERKGFRYLLRAFAQLRQRRTGVRLVVVGPYDANQQARHRRTCTRLGIPDVVFAGYATSSDLARYYASSDVVCVPSLGSESFGIVLLEAMAAGRPIVASRIPGYRDVVDDGSQGLLVSPADADSLCEALDALVGDPERRDALGQQGRAKAAAYAWPIVAERVVAYYASVLAGESRFKASDPVVIGAPAAPTLMPSLDR